MIPKKWTLPRIAAVLAFAVALVWGWGQYHLHFPNYEHAMTELTRDMRPICIGRFMVSIPAQAKLQQMGQSIMGMGKVEMTPNVSQAVFRHIVKQREEVLRNTKHRKEGTVLHEVFAPDGMEARIFVYRDHEINVRYYSVDGFFWRDSRLYKFNYGAQNNGVEESKRELLQAFTQIRPRDNSEIPTVAGTCIDGGFVPGRGYRQEDVGASFIFPDYPGLYLSVNFASTDTPDKEGLIARDERHTPAFNFNYPGAKYKYFRKVKKSVAQMPGEELVSKVYDETYGNEIMATWEFSGDANSNQRPSVVMELSYGGTVPQIDPSKPRNEPVVWKLRDEEVLALWDAFVNSLRPRPGAF